MNEKMSHLANFNNETAKTILVDILKTATQPENAKKLSEAKALSGKEMIKMMQFVFPLVMEIEMSILRNYGFPPNREGLVQFAQLVREVRLFWFTYMTLDSKSRAASDSVREKLKTLLQSKTLSSNCFETVFYDSKHGISISDRGCWVQS